MDRMSAAAKFDPMQHTLYKQALFKDECKDAVIETLEYRYANFGSFSDCGKFCNVATVILYFVGSCPIQCTAESKRTQQGYNYGHSERRSLALAINQAITEKKDGFAELPFIRDRDTDLQFDKDKKAPKFDLSLIDRYSKVLSSIEAILMYTERQPCHIGQPEPCFVFLEKIFTGNNFHIYYSIPTKQNTKDMDDDLLAQFKEAWEAWKAYSQQKEQKTKELLAHIPVDMFYDKEETAQFSSTAKRPHAEEPEKKETSSSDKPPPHSRQKQDDKETYTSATAETQSPSHIEETILTVGVRSKQDVNATQREKQATLMPMAVQAKEISAPTPPSQPITTAANEAAKQTPSLAASAPTTDKESTKPQSSGSSPKPYKS